MKVLIVYATAAGSTRSIAERIATRISTTSSNTYATTVLPADVEPPPNLSEFNAVIIGSCIHAQKWIAPAQNFIKAHSEELKANPKPTWIFSVGMPAAWPKWISGSLKMAEKEQDKVGKEVAKYVDFKGHQLFNGEWKTDEVPLLARWFFGGTGLIKFGDYRDWDAIDAWADKVLQELQLPGSN